MKLKDIIWVVKNYKEYKIIKESELFFRSYYLEKNEDVRYSRIDPLVHFCRKGWREMRNPNTFFDTAWYLKTYKDIKRMNINPLYHYIVEGWKDGEDPSKHFSTSTYISSNQDLKELDYCPLTHYIKFGIYEKRRIV